MGDIVHIPTGEVCKKFMYRGGKYLHVNLPNVGILYMHCAACLLLYKIIYLEEGIVSRHLDGNFTNNSPSNIRIGTAKDNANDVPKDKRHALAIEREKNKGAAKQSAGAKKGVLTLGKEGVMARTRKAQATMTPQQRTVANRKRSLTLGGHLYTKEDLIQIDFLLTEYDWSSYKISEYLSLPRNSAGYAMHRQFGFKHLPPPPIPLDYPEECVYPLIEEDQILAEELVEHNIIKT